MQKPDSFIGCVIKENQQIICFITCSNQFEEIIFQPTTTHFMQDISLNLKYGLHHTKKKFSQSLTNMRSTKFRSRREFLCLKNQLNCYIFFRSFILFTRQIDRVNARHDSDNYQQQSYMKSYLADMAAIFFQF